MVSFSFQRVSPRTFAFIMIAGVLVALALSWSAGGSMMIYTLLALTIIGLSVFAIRHVSKERQTLKEEIRKRTGRINSESALALHIGTFYPEATDISFSEEGNCMVADFVEKAVQYRIIHHENEIYTHWLDSVNDRVTRLSRRR